MANITVLFIESCGGIKSATATLNMMTGSSYKTGRLMEWVRGIRQPSPLALNTMLQLAVPLAVSTGRLPELRLAL